MAITLKLLGFSLWLIIMAFLITGGKSGNALNRKKMQAKEKDDNQGADSRKAYIRQAMMDRLTVISGNNPFKPARLLFLLLT